MKRILLLLVITIMLATASLVSADTPTPKKIRIAAFNFYPTLFQAKDGSVQGFYVDFLSEIAKREGWAIEYVYGNWAEGLSRIKSGEVDVLTNVALTTERTQFMDYGKVPLLTVWAELYAPNGSPIDNIMNVKNKKIALMKGDFNAANFKNLVEKFSIPCTYVEYGNFEEVFKAISARQVDAGIVNNTFGTAKQTEYKLKSTGVIFNPFDIFFTVAKGKNSVVLATLDRYLEEWRKKESSPYHKARESWSHKSASTIRVVHPWMKKAAVISGILLCVTVGFVILLRIQVRRKTIEIQKYTDELLLATRQLEEELAERQVAQEALQVQTVILEEEIAERKQTEEALQRSEEMMLNSQSVAHICSYSTKLNVNKLDESSWVCSPEFYKIFGIDEAYPHTIAGWAGFIHPDHREELVAYHEDVVKNRTTFSHDYKIIRINDGAERWVYGTGELVYDEHGNPVRMHGAIQDITERKQAEIALATSSILLQSIINTVPMRIFWKDNELN